MDLELTVNRYSRIGIGVVTTSIAIALFYLTGFLLINAVQYSWGVFVLALSFTLLALWFAKLSHRLVFSVSPHKQPLFSPFSIVCIFTIFCCGAAAGAIFRFSTGNIEQGVICLLILCLLFPAGNFCWRHAQKRATPTA